MLFGSEPPPRWPQDHAQADVKSRFGKAHLRNLTLSEALKRAEFASRIPDVVTPVLEDQSPEPVSQQCRSAAEFSDATRQNAFHFRKIMITQTQAVSFLAGIGAVTIGKFVFITLLYSVSWSGIYATHGNHPALAGGLMNSNTDTTVDAVHATLRRLAFTSSDAFSEAAAAFRTREEVSLAGP